MDSVCKHMNIRITGRVQGVGFRYSAVHLARQLNIKGFIRNMPDRSVYIEAEGTELQLNEFVSWCIKGPPRSKILQVDAAVGIYCAFNEFEVK